MFPNMAREANGAAIRAIREALGMSQAFLAARANTAAGHLSCVERGLHHASPQLIRRIATELGVPVAAISSVVPEPEDVPEEVPA